MRLLRLLAILPMALALSGQAPGAGDPDFSPERIRADVTYLADDKLEGRFTVSKGYLEAAVFVANRFAELGLKPGGDVQNWFQFVPIALPVDAPTHTYQSPKSSASSPAPIPPFGTNMS